MTRRTRPALLALAAALGVGCACTPPQPTEDAGVITCENDPRVLAYAPGMTQTSGDGAVMVKLVGSDPTPPARGTNTWQTKITDGSGGALASPTVKVDLFMPDHGHGSPQVPTVTPQAEGAFEIGNVYFFMPGVWRARFTVTCGTSTGLVDYLFCIPG